MEEFDKKLYKYFPNTNIEAIEIFHRMMNIYEKWNQKINLISRKDVCHLYERHVLHSLMIHAVLKLKKGNSVVDVGSGGGFPGIPLAILHPDVKFFLVDSIKKKSFAVQEIANELGLKNIIVCNERMESINQKFDYVIGRAVTNLHDFINLVSKNQKKSSGDAEGGIYYLSGDTSTESISREGFRVDKIACSNFFEEEFFSEKYLYIVKEV